MPDTAIQRSYVPADIDLSDWAQAQPLYDGLLARPIVTADDLASYLADWGELAAVVGEHQARTNVEHACHTDDAAVEARYLHLVRELQPRLAPLEDQLRRKALDAPPALIDALDERWREVFRHWRADVGLYRDANVPLFTKLTEQATVFDKLVGEMLVEFDGETLTLQQLAKHEADPDRAVRERAWRAGAVRRLRDRDAISDVFAQQVALRGEVAANAGEASFVDYAMKQRHRFDYGPGECFAFHDAILEHCVPLARELDAAKRDGLGVESLRPWDHDAEPNVGAPLSPFDADSGDDLRGKSIETVAAVAPWLGEHLERLRQGTHLDLVSRKGKRGGGFQASMPEVGEPFIFMNAAGRSDDVRTMLHEAGHAFHYQLERAAQPSVFMQRPPIEMAEVASMSMELLTLDALDPFYPDPADKARAQREQLEGVIRLLPWVAIIDRFQHEVYTHPSEGIAGWTKRWRAITDAFGTRHGGTLVDWSGLDAERDAYWQRQIHLFHYPFYYVEYGIAQLGALQVWQNAQCDPAGALQRYREALSLGGTRPLPALFEAAGARFDFSAATLAPLIDAVRAKLEGLG